MANKHEEVDPNDDDEEFYDDLDEELEGPESGILDDEDTDDWDSEDWEDYFDKKFDEDDDSLD